MRRVAALAALLSGLAAAPAAAEELVLWHAYHGDEAAALAEWAAGYGRRTPGISVRLLEVPAESITQKLTNAIPRGHGPDVFVWAHEQLGAWVETGLLAPLPAEVEREAEETQLAGTVDPLVYHGRLYGLPIAFKSAALFRNTRLVPEAPATTDELLAAARPFSDPDAGRFGLAYEVGTVYYQAAWLHGFGGGVRGPQGDLGLTAPGNARSLEFAARLVAEGLVPADANGALVTELFTSERAPFAIQGPWFVADCRRAGIPFAISPLPEVSETGLPARPFLTIETAFLSAGSRHPEAALALLRDLAGPESARLRALRGGQPVSARAAYDDPRVAADPALAAFREQLGRAVPMPTEPAMRALWEPAAFALRSVLRGDLDAATALDQAERRFRIFTRPPPAAADPLPFAVGVGLLLFGAAVFAVRRGRRAQVGARMWRHRRDYLYLVPAGLGVLLLLVVPFVVGAAVSLAAHQGGGEFSFVGLRNFVQILSSADFGLTEPESFYFTLVVTLLWTVLNVGLHLALGIALALLLREPWVRLRGVWRVLLIIPWAVPNYITALIWKGMFHRQLGAINAILGWFGVEPVGWFDRFSTAFAANLATNVWLGFPFMMVVTLGALQTIPKDVEEAAAIDGAGAWTRFWRITLPMIRSSLVPAVVLGSVWTFNMFNVIYLVSGGDPEGRTEILISQAYRWAFSRQEQYGYAAAYAVLIFGILLAFDLLSRRWTRTEASR
ncbi:MAG: extracellular solute-binding protein [Deltaproteobacteria bacterium]|nr:extracellular solute-binding protein [Deltaproteobacteria bacterium]